MRYFFLNPFNKQYLFPEDYKNYPVFETFYQAYTLKGKTLWFLWYNLRFLRSINLVASPEKIVPIEHINRYISSSTILAFNRGTAGFEQKITILGVDKESKEEIFIKYASTEIACRNVKNEGEILLQLKCLDFVPQLEKIIEDATFTLIQTNVLKGNRLYKQKVDDQLIKVLTQLAELDVKVERNYSTAVVNSFAHGDFCPWNMMLDKKKLKIFDWEMAGSYPIGYDLFTFVFQTSFLLTPRKKIETILFQNVTLITCFFKMLKISEWKPYLIAFALLKLELETKKQNQQLMKHYKDLLENLQNT